MDILEKLENAENFDSAKFYTLAEARELLELVSNITVSVYTFKKVCSKLGLEIKMIGRTNRVTGETLKNVLQEIVK